MVGVGKMRVAPAAAQERAGIGHNGGPTVEPFGLHAPWLRFATEIELRQLAKIHLRIERRRMGISFLVSDRQRIMNRCIRRMRRASGKN